LFGDETGATALEYAMVTGVIALACLVAIGLFGQKVASLFVVNF
jgi:Flp pilus assembly pilin Flp